MLIGELGKRSGVSPKTIRYYEEIGLLPPPERTPSGYRAYGDDAVARLSFIHAGQSIGLALGEIREVLAFRDRGERPCGYVLDLIERRAADLAKTIASLERMRRDLVRLARKGRATGPPADDRDGRYCHIIEG
jgi:DNA-binding transcriptional MerR regulator